MPQVYVSITGLRLKSLWHIPRFQWHAIRSFQQAQNAPGILKAEAKTIDGVHHTLTVWVSEDAMRTFLRSGAHRRAIRIFSVIATGKTFGFATSTPPSWNDAHRLWQERAQVVGKKPDPDP
ncbi:MAG: hypothetical protein AAFY56_03135 [Pseudomonadota bacterium]